MLPGRRYTAAEIRRIVWRGKWLVLLPIVAVGAAAAVLVRTLPDRYRADVVLQVLPTPRAGVPPGAGASKVRDRLPGIVQQVTARDVLAPIVRDFTLYGATRDAVPTDDLLARLRADIEVEPVGDDAVTVHVRAGNPYIAHRVAERIGSALAAAPAAPAPQADATSRFLEGQVEDARRRLLEHEQLMETFRARHADALGSHDANALQALQDLDVRLQSVSDALARARGRRQGLARALELYTSGAVSAAADDSGAPALATAELQLAALRESLRGLRARLAPDHPDVVRAERVVTELEARIARGQTSAPGAATAATTTLLENLRADVAAVTKEIGERQFQLTQLQGEMGSYRSPLADPALQSELDGLRRDHETIRSVYADLLAKREEAVVAADPMYRPSGDRFRVIGPAVRPARLDSPDRALIARASAAGGVLLGLLTLLVAEIRNRSLRTGGDVVAMLHLPVLATVPRIPNSYDRRRRLRTMLGASAAGVVVVAVAAVAAWRWWR